MHLAEPEISHDTVSPPKTPPQDYHVRAQEKRAQQAAQIPVEWRLSSVPSIEEEKDALNYIRTSNHLSAEELSITEMCDIADPLGKLASGELSSVQVVSAFSKRAAIAHQLTTCCTELFFEEALKDAKRLDDILEKTGKPVGPLHGLPVSVKDSVDVKGYDTSIGEFYNSGLGYMTKKKQTYSCSY